jgi:hypothetical protein
MAARRKGMSKTAFVLGLPADMPAKDVVVEATKKGIKLTDRYVYVIRSNANANARGGWKSRVTKRGRGRRGSSAGVEAELRRAIAELGLARAREVLAQVESAFRR